MCSRIGPGVRFRLSQYPPVENKHTDLIKGNYYFTFREHFVLHNDNNTDNDEDRSIQIPENEDVICGKFIRYLNNNTRGEFFLTKNNGLTLDTERKQIIDLDMFVNFYLLNRLMSEEAEGTYVSSLYKENGEVIQSPKKLSYLAGKTVPIDKLNEALSEVLTLPNLDLASSQYGGKRRKSIRKRRKRIRKRRKSIRKRRKTIRKT
jgi:hypothetical protein